MFFLLATCLFWGETYHLNVTFSLFSRAFLFARSTLVSLCFCFSYSYSNALDMLPLSAFVTLHVSWLCFWAVYVAHIFPCFCFYHFFCAIFLLGYFIFRCNVKQLFSLCIWNECYIFNLESTLLSSSTSNFHWGLRFSIIFTIWHLFATQVL